MVGSDSAARECPRKVYILVTTVLCSSGFLYRRLDQGRLHFLRADMGAVELSAAQWAILVEG
jgi:hypothetical protein